MRCVVISTMVLWSFLPGAICGQAKDVTEQPRLMAQLWHEDFVRQLALTPDGRFLVTGDGKKLIVWDRATGRQLRRLESPEQGAVRASTNGQWMVLLEDERADVWSVDTGKKTHVVPTKKDNRYGVMGLSDNGRWMLLSEDVDTAELWDIAAKRKARDFKVKVDNDSWWQLSPDGNWIAAVSGKPGKLEVTLWRNEQQAPVHKLKGIANTIVEIAFAPDGSSLAFQVQRSDKTEGGFEVWSTATGKKLHRFKGRDITPDPNNPLGTLPATGLAYSADGKFLATPDKDKARIWDLATGKEESVVPLPHTPMSMALAHDRKTLMASDGMRSAVVVAVPSGKVQQTIEGSAIPIMCVGTSGPYLLTGSGTGPTLAMWDVRSGKVHRLLKSPHAHRDYLAARMKNYSRITLSANGQWGLAFTSHGGFMDNILQPPMPNAKLRPIEQHYILWELATGGEVKRWQDKGDALQFELPPGLKLPGLELPKIEQPPGTPTMPGGISNDGKQLLLSGNVLGLKMLDIAAGTRRPVERDTKQPFEPDPDVATEIAALSPDAAFVLQAGNGKVRLLDVKTGKSVMQAKAEEATWPFAEFTLDGSHFLAGNEQDYIRVWNTKTRKLVATLKDDNNDFIYWRACFSRDGRLIAAGDWLGELHLCDAATGKKIRSFQESNSGIDALGFVENDTKLLAAHLDGTTRLLDVATGKELCRLIVFHDDSWAVVDAQGRYDASGAGVSAGLHWVVGLEPIELRQLKERYYDPGLLAKYLGYNKDPLRKAEVFKDVKLFPAAKFAEPAKDGKLAIDLTNRGGGIGKIQVFVNGRELLADARGPTFDPKAETAKLTVDLANAPSLQPGQENIVEVVTWNADGYLSSRGLKREWTPEGPKEESLALHAIVVGVSEYANPALNLRYSAKDAEDMAKALELGAKRLFGADKVHLTLLTGAKIAFGPPTKANIQNAFEAARKARPSDVLVVYLAGHGVSLSAGSDLYCFLTKDARSADVNALSDPAVLAQYAVTSAELTEWIKKIPALKQVMILDTCAAGAAAKSFVEQRHVTGDQIRAIEKLKDRTGFQVLMGCAADKVSYEATQFEQGLLTHALLKGMRGAALDRDEYVDVSKLFQYAADEVESLAKYIGGIQKPIIAAPRGTSFPVGRLTNADKTAIPLAIPKPLLLRPLLLNPDESDDNLSLMSHLRTALADRAAASPRGQSIAVFVDADVMAGAIRPSGTYTTEGDAVKVKLALRKDGKTLATLNVEGTRDQLPALSERIVQRIFEALGK